MKSSLRRSLGLPALVVLFAASGCAAGGGPAGPAVPTPPDRAVGPCRALHKVLPESVDGMKRRTADPVSDFTAVWGDPAIALRCGVQRPEVIRAGSKTYAPSTGSVEADGVEWLPERQPDGSVRCTTVQREVWVEVTLPKKVAGDAGDLGALTDLADAVKKTIPFGYVD
ncbi:DUF3515 domain-containing protein [Streptomyces sp. NPDC002537]